MRAGSAVLAFVLFLVTPLGEPLRLTAYGIVSPIVRRLLNNGLTYIGSTPVTLENETEFSGLKYTVDVSVKDGEKSPGEGCFGGDWLKKNGGLATDTEMFGEVVTGRTDVALVAADLKFSVRKSNAQAAVSCLGGGDGASTHFNYTITRDGHVKTSSSGAGASEAGDFLVLRLEPGRIYPIAVTMRVDGYQVVEWQATLRFRVGDKDFKIPLADAKTAGSEGLPQFYAGSDGIWRRSP